MKHLWYSQIHATLIWWHMHHTIGTRFRHCDPILVLTILGANIFPGGLMSIVVFRMFCASCPNWKPWKNMTSKWIGPLWSSGDHICVMGCMCISKPQFHPHKQSIALTTFETTKFWTQKMIKMSMQVLFCLKIDAPKQSGRKKWVHDGLGFYSHRPSFVGWNYDLQDCKRVGLITHC